VIALELEPVKGETDTPPAGWPLAPEAKARVSEAWERLAAAELTGGTRREEVHAGN
jgi:hypothetical protein